MFGVSWLVTLCVLVWILKNMVYHENLPLRANCFLCSWFVGMHPSLTKRVAAAKNEPTTGDFFK
jgi:hypothetical protein